MFGEVSWVVGGKRSDEMTTPILYSNTVSALLRIEAGSVCYVKEIGYEFVWNGGEFEIGEEFKGYVKTVEPRVGKVEWAEAVL